MKITIAKLFEMGGLPENLQKIEPLVAFINGAVDQLVKALQGRLTLRDNVYCEIRTVAFRPPAVLADPVSGALMPWVAEFMPAQRTVEGVVVLQAEATDGNTPGSWSYAFTSKGSLLISVYPRISVATSNEMKVKFAVLFQ